MKKVNSRGKFPNESCGLKKSQIAKMNINKNLNTESVVKRYYLINMRRLQCHQNLLHQ